MTWVPAAKSWYSTPRAAVAAAAAAAAVIGCWMRRSVTTMMTSMMVKSTKLATMRERALLAVDIYTQYTHH